ncbi:hypothetical protein FRB96_007851 [Tulasnella sp. 330]|nr:hypothetical protein FRB96_007851 [Tulasnella sp. 330]KAG8879143.1 hypothetical protein FRB97_001923 [Tulasnella sp. 331]
MEEENACSSQGGPAQKSKSASAALSIVTAVAAVPLVTLTPRSTSSFPPLPSNPFPAGTLRGLNTLAKAHGRYFGTALQESQQRVNDTKYTYLSASFSEFGMVTPENDMKWELTEFTQGDFTFAGADYVLGYAHHNGQTVRGHNFVWYNQLGQGILAPYINWTNSTILAIIKEHIQAVGGRYKGQLYVWDVVNEPLNDDGTFQTNIWYNVTGSYYIKYALQVARETDPYARLYINDYNIETVSNKSNAYLNLVKGLLAEGVPLDGIGCETHLILGETPSTADMITNFQRFADLGLEWAITELDIRMDLANNATEGNSTQLAQQATEYAQVVSACLGISTCVGITTWETSDSYSWVPGVFTGQGSGLLFDFNSNPKPAYYAVADALAGHNGTKIVDGPFVSQGGFNDWENPKKVTDPKRRRGL